MTKAPPKPRTLEQIIYAMRGNLRVIHDSKMAQHKATRELYSNAYLYVETAMQQDHSHAEAVSSLADSLGKSRELVLQWLKYASFMKQFDGNLEKVVPSALSKISGRRIEKRHLKTLIKDLQEGAGPSAIERKLAKYGYIPNYKVKPWARPLVRKYEDVREWESEINELESALAACAGKKVEVLVFVDDEQVF